MQSVSHHTLSMPIPRWTERAGTSLVSSLVLAPRDRLLYHSLRGCTARRLHEQDDHHLDRRATADCDPGGGSGIFRRCPVGRNGRSIDRRGNGWRGALPQSGRRSASADVLPGCGVRVYPDRQHPRGVDRRQQDKLQSRRRHWVWLPVRSRRRSRSRTRHSPGPGDACAPRPNQHRNRRPVPDREGHDLGDQRRRGSGRDRRPDPQATDARRGYHAQGERPVSRGAWRART